MTHPAVERAARMAARERCALALLALSGVALLPGALNRFVFPKLVVVGVGVALAATVPARGRLPRAAVALLVAGAAVLVIAALAGPMPLAQLIGLAPRYEGALVLPLYIGAGVAGARLLGHQRARGSSRWFLGWLAVAAIAIAIEAVLETAGLRPLASNVSRPGSLLGNASDEGAWAVLALGPLTAVAIRVGGRLFTLGALAAAVTVACSASRGALVGAIVVAGVLVALAPARMLRVAVVTCLVALLVGSLALPATRARVTGSGGDASQTVTGRRLLWSETGRLLAHRPLLGVGPGGYLNTIPRYHTADYERQIGPANPPDSPHDWLLQAAVDGGLPLLALALALAGLALRRGWLSVGTQETGGEAAVVGGMLAGLVGYGVALLFHFTSPGTTPLAAVFGGALLAGLPGGGAVQAGGGAAGDLLARAWTRWHAAGRAVALAVTCALTLVMAGGAAAEIPLRLAIDDAASDRLPASDREFRLARDLRPWDASVAATAAHAYATLASYGIRPAIAPGLHWAAIELRRMPDSIEALADAATLELAAGRRTLGLSYLDRALALDPRNPDLLHERDQLSGSPNR